MISKLPRREFLKISALAASLPFASGLHGAVPPAKKAGVESDGLTVYELGPQIWIRWNNRPLTCYRAHRSQKYPYMYPLAGPLTGLSLTDETALPYPHHRSLFFACDRVNGGNYWQEGYEKGQILSTGPKVSKPENNSVEITDTCEWRKPTGPIVMRDRRRILVSAPDKNLRFLDWEIEWEAVEDVEIPKTNHSLFAMRAAPDIAPSAGGNLVNAQGLSGETQTAGQKSEWCGFYGKRSTVPGAPVEGIVIMNHPGNPLAPTEWFTRDYGFASPTPLWFRDTPLKIAAGKALKLNYRVVLFSGDPKQAGIQAIYTRWAAPA